ncbi:MAG: hypothetical protein IH828_05485 [Nitrospinae bacterium]|nr:hypothetical protein [Nitrospinota bacterium]
MKFLKTTTLALVVSLCLAPMSSAWARNGRHGIRGGSAIHGGHGFRGHHGFRGRHHAIPIHSSSTTIIERHDNGAAFVALASGTMLGLVVGSLVNQPHPTAQPQVVVVQANQQRYLELEIERERARARTLELELELRYLEQGLY